MPAKRDPLDVTFMDRIKDMLGLDRDEASDRLEALDSDDLIDLTDAVTKGDKDRAKRIMDIEQTEEDEDSRKDINPLFGPDTHNVEDDTEDKEEEPKASTGRRRKEKESDESGAAFDIGDKVTMGKKSGVVEIPRGPSNTVGVRMDGRLHMVDRNKLSRLDEHVIGMTGIPDIARMQMLAGIAPSSSATVIDVTPAEEHGSDLSDSARVADEALTALEREIGNVKVADLGSIRRRLNAITNRLNESHRKTR